MIVGIMGVVEVDVVAKQLAANWMVGDLIMHKRLPKSRDARGRTAGRARQRKGRAAGREIVRLPNGVFAPYTGIPTNILFLDRSGPTSEVWYYQHPLPERRKSYTKTQPIQFDEFASCQSWWTERKENDQAWKVSAQTLLQIGCNLDQKNPRSNADLEHMPPAQLAEDVLAKELRIAELMNEIKIVLGPKA